MFGPREISVSIFLAGIPVLLLAAYTEIENQCGERAQAEFAARCLQVPKTAPGFGTTRRGPGLREL